MKNISLLVLLAFTTTQAFAQFTKSSFTLLDAAEGTEIAQFTDSVKVAIGPQESGWYKTTLKVLVAKSAVSADSVLAADAEILDEDKNKIGQTTSEIKVKYQQAEGRGYYKFYEIIITGYIKSYSLEYKSIPERGLEKIINQKSMAGRQEQLEAFFNTMGFVESTFGEYTVWTYLDEAASFGEAHYRTIVVFRGETSLYCIISKTETMSLEKLKDTYSDHTGNYFFFQRYQDKTLKQMQDVAYSFIPL